MDQRHVVPGVRFAVDAYVNFARRAPWQEAVCSSLTELFAPEIHKQRLANWPEHYPWIEPDGLAYFRNRVSQARRDVEQGLAITLDHFTTRAQQERALEVLQFKLDILWAMNDAMALALRDRRTAHDRDRQRSATTPAACSAARLPPAVGAGAGLPTCCSTPRAWSSSTAARGEIMKRCDGKRSVADDRGRPGDARFRAHGPRAATCAAFVEMRGQAAMAGIGMTTQRKARARRCGCWPS